MNPENKPLLLYQAYGSLHFLHEAIYSVLSLYRIEKNPTSLFQILIYTDNISYLKTLLPTEIQYRELDRETIQQWKGSPPFIHRVKIKMIEEVIMKYEGEVIYLDTDTVFRSSPIRLLEKKAQGLLMHKLEGKLTTELDPLSQKLRRFFKKHPYFLNQKVTIPYDLTLFNAGVLGFNTTQIRETISLILALSDELYATYPKHVMEQIAFTYFFSLDRSPETADDEIYHYWFFKDFRTHLKIFFEENKDKPLEEILPSLSNIDPEKLYTSMQKQSWFAKLIAKFS